MFEYIKGGKATVDKRIFKSSMVILSVATLVQGESS